MNWMEALRRALGLETYRRPSFVDGRSTFRMRCTLPVAISVQEGKQPRTLQGQVINVSTRGVKLEVSALLRRGERAELLIRASRPPRSPRSIPELKLIARVIWCKRRGNEAWEAGMEFIEFGRHRPADILSFLRQELPNAVPDDKQRRHSQRLICRWPVDFSINGSKRYSGVVKDISRRGILLLTREPLSLWSELRLSIQLDDNLPPLEAHGVVRRCNKVHGEDWWEVASPLSEVSPEDRQRLELIIENRLKEQ